MRVETRTVASLCGVELCALASLLVPLFVGLAIRVPDVTDVTREVALSAVVVPGAIAAMVMNPVFGWLSDRSANRTRWIVGGALGGFVAAIGVAAAPTLPLLIISWCAMQGAYNATFAALYGSLSDRVHEADRARVSGWFAASATGALVLGMGAVVALPRSTFVLIMLIPLLTVPVAIAAARHLNSLELTTANTSRTDAERRMALWSALGGASAGYWWVWLQRLVTQGAYSVVGLYGIYYLQRRVGLSESSAATWIASSTMVAGVLSMVAAIAVGRIVSRFIGYRTLLMVSLTVLGCALGIKAVGTVPEMYVVAALVAGVGIGAYSALDLSLALRAVEGSNAGTLLGFFNVARTLPQSLVPLAAPALLAVGSGDPLGLRSSQNYLALNLGGVALTIVAIALVVPVGASLLRGEGREPVPTPAVELS